MVRAVAGTRAGLASQSGTHGQGAMVWEDDRSGQFMFDATDLSALVSADPEQAIHIPPSSAPTGSAGAWVRKFDGAVNVRWFGAVADNATDDSAAFLAAIAYLKATRQPLGFGYGSGSGELFVPAGRYYLGTTTLDLTHTITIRGEAMGLTGGGSTVLRWAAGTTGIRVQAYNTTGAAGVIASPPDNTAGTGSTIERLFLQGGYVAPTEGEYHGVHLRGMATVRDVYITGFPGDGIHAAAAAGSGGALEGNANNTRLQNVTVERCRNGIYFDGADGNACYVLAANVSSNRQWGIWDSSFLGNTYVACHSASNGWDGATGSTPTASTFGGNRYFVKPGQATGASTNAPSGTTADNTWWGYVGAGGVYAGVVAWVNGTTFREGGAYKTDDPNGANTFIGCYIEGDQNPSQISAPSILVGGNIATGTNRGNGLSLAPAQSSVAFGPQLAQGQDFDVYFDNSGTTSALNFRNWAAGVSNVNARFFSAGNDFYVDVKGALRWRLNGSNTLLLYAPAFQPTTDNSIDLGSSTERWKNVYAKGYYVDATKVIGAQGAAIADAANAVAAPTKAEFDALVLKFNTLLARVRTHGLIAP